MRVLAPRARWCSEIVRYGPRLHDVRGGEGLVLPRLAGPRFKAIYLEFPELEREMTAAEVAYFQRAEMVEPGRTITRTLEDPLLGCVEFAFRGF